MSKPGQVKERKPAAGRAPTRPEDVSGIPGGLGSIAETIENCQAQLEGVRAMLVPSLDYGKDVPEFIGWAMDAVLCQVAEVLENRAECLNSMVSPLYKALEGKSSRPAGQAVRK